MGHWEGGCGACVSDRTPPNPHPAVNNEDNNGLGPQRHPENLFGICGPGPRLPPPFFTPLPPICGEW